MLKYANILFIDDDEDACFLNRNLIERLKIATRVQALTSGQAALDFIQANFQNDQDEAAIFPALMFVDINMPGMNGYEFLQEFEKLHNVQKNGIRIYLLTSLTHPADLEEARKLNIDGILSKPLTAEKLISLAQEKNSPVS